MFLAKSDVRLQKLSIDKKKGSGRGKELKTRIEVKLKRKSDGELHERKPKLSG